MGLFDRRATSSPSGASGIGAAELAEATELMDRWDAALGDSDAMFACLAQIARRPWAWWAAASRAAGAAGEHALAGRIFLFAHLFTTRLVDRISPEKQRETGLGRPDPDAYRAIAEQAVAALVQLPPELMIHDTATGKVDVAAAWTMAQAVVAA
ncbi:hypothetical protein SAMN05660485_03649 [Blastococcus fimeti]|nr:hypothetical protein SAMN05660485_03649 [Blastococcus fimeti]